MPYVRDAWYASAWTHEIASERLTGVRVLNDPIVIWRNAAGDLAAFEDRCVHRLAPLSLGRCEGERLRCIYHGLLYDGTGRVIEIPGQDRIPSGFRVRTYPVVERHGWVWVWMGDTAAADDSLIPAVVGLDHPGFIFGHGQLDYAAEARLINDNLLDLSHVGFLHAESLRSSETWARERPKVAQHERSIRIERWIRGHSVQNFATAGKLVDAYYGYDFVIPGVFLMTVRTYPAGTADALHGRQPDLNQAPEHVASHAVTPLTDKTARYFYINGRRPCEGVSEDRDVYDIFTLEKAFAEDKQIIEAQQRNIDITPGWKFRPTTADEGVALFNRLAHIIREAV